MPQTDSSSIVVNCGTRLQGQTSLEYLVVFCETMRHTHKLSGRGSTETVIPDKAESLRIDIFELQESSANSRFRLVDRMGNDACAVWNCCCTLDTLQ